MSETGEVIDLSMETWVSIGTLLGVGTAMTALMLNAFRSQRADLTGQISDVRGMVIVIDQRVYDLATGRAPRTLIVPNSG